MNTPIIFKEGLLVLSEKKYIKGDVHERINTRHRLASIETFIKQHPLYLAMCIEIPYYDTQVYKEYLLSDKMSLIPNRPF